MSAEHIPIAMDMIIILIHTTTMIRLGIIMAVIVPIQIPFIRTTTTAIVGITILIITDTIITMIEVSMRCGKLSE